MKPSNPSLNQPDSPVPEAIGRTEVAGRTGSHPGAEGSNSVAERVKKRCESFEVGDFIEALVDGAEVEGEIIKVTGPFTAKVKTKYGTFTCSLTTAIKLPVLVDNDDNREFCRDITHSINCEGPCPERPEGGRY